MTLDALNEAIAEAHRFVNAAVIARTVLEKNKACHGDTPWQDALYDGHRMECHAPGPTNAAAKRASMDLTRALARMRR